MALLVFLPRTSQGGLQHSKLPGPPAPTSATQALQNLLDIFPTLGVVFPVKALPILIQGKNILGPAAAVAQGAAHKCSTLRESSPVPHRALKSNNHIAAPITHLRLGARSPTETTSQAQEPMHSLSPSLDLPSLLRTLAVTLPIHHCIPVCPLQPQEEKSISAPSSQPCPAWAGTFLGLGLPGERTLALPHLSICWSLSFPSSPCLALRNVGPSPGLDSALSRSGSDALASHKARASAWDTGTFSAPRRPRAPKSRITCPKPHSKCLHFRADHCPSPPATAMQETAGI